ncbi:hypothetical protein CPC08DRAFT_813227 [Agrocybe pediades]|nr:hypothetical protein CPC08DRAFT_813227 [Agrocybe pediades]
MSAVDFKVSITVQKALISADLNSSLMMQLIFGIYTAVLGPAIYVHIRKENRASPQSIIIAGIMIVLYCMTAFVVAVSWYYTSIQFCKQATRAAIFSSADSGIPVPVLILIDLSQNIGFLMADGLLVWRCYHACGGSFRSNILSMGLFIVEITLVVASAIFDCLLYLRPELETHQLILVSDYLDGASFISVAATSLVATFMICYQIYSRTTPGSGARRLYRHIVDALVQSSCVYTVTVILLAIVDFLVNSPNFRVNADILEALALLSLVWRQPS